MLEAFIEALRFLFTPTAMSVMFITVVISMIGGIIPGIGAKVTCSLFLPFLWLMQKETALLVLVSLQACSMTAGSITAIVLNIPGTNPNAATLIDGFPMNQKGEGSRAIGASVMASMAGGAIPVFLCLAMIPMLLPILMAFRAPEMAMLTLLGLSFMAALTGKSISKGIISGALGVAIGMIGFHGSTGVYRFTFGSNFLYDGPSVATFALGLFGLAELFDMKLKGQATIAQEEVSGKFSDVLRGVKDVWTYKWLWFRSAMIGYIVGLIPGIGAEVSTFVAYGQAKQLSKNPEKFGKGCVEGVIAPESANNAKEASSLLTTMAFGIPGSSLMAILMGGFLMVGVTPGPKFLADNLPLALILLLGIAITNVMGGVICLFAAPYLGRIARVHIDFIFSGVLVILFVGAFVIENSMLNILMIFILALLGVIMKRYGYSRPALLLGFILGALAELYTLRSFHLYGPFFFKSPICLAIIGIIVAVFTFPYLKKRTNDPKEVK